MREYETIFVLKGNTPESEVEELIGRVSKLVTGQEGTIFFTRSWGKRQMAFPIAKEKEGIYIHIDYTGSGTLVNELEKALKLNERVLRFLTVVLQERVDIAKRTQELSDQEAAAQSAKAAAQSATA